MFVRFSDIDEPMEDPRTGDTLYKVVFVVIFQGEELRSRVRKICEAFHASIYPCPQNAAERREMKIGVETYNLVSDPTFVDSLCNVNTR